jgi:hypothetical protein
LKYETYKFGLVWFPVMLSPSYNNFLDPVIGSLLCTKTYLGF